MAPSALTYPEARVPPGPPMYQSQEHLYRSQGPQGSGSTERASQVGWQSQQDTFNRWRHTQQPGWLA